jgi:hypothetical protein
MLASANNVGSLPQIPVPENLLVGKLLQKFRNLELEFREMKETQWLTKCRVEALERKLESLLKGDQ